jgi:anti-anti-sigma factor
MRCRWIRLTGELHTGTVMTARRAIWPELERSTELIVDLEGVTFIDSAGLGFLLAVRREVARRGKRWALVGISPPIARVLAMTHADRLLPLFISLADAEKAWAEADADGPAIEDTETNNAGERLSRAWRLTR